MLVVALGAACSPYTLRESPSDADTRASIGGAGALDFGDFVQDSGDESVGAIGISRILGRDPGGAGEHVIQRLDAGVELWNVFDGDLGQGISLTDVSVGLSWVEPWADSPSRLSDGRLSYGVGLFFAESGIGAGSATSVESTAFGVEGTGEYEVRCGAGESWNLTGFVGGGLQLGATSQEGPALDVAGGGGSSSQFGFSTQAGLRCYWDSIFLETSYLYRYLDVGFADFDFQGGVISFGLTW